jgi:hypothetical protein
MARDYEHIGHGQAEPDGELLKPRRVAVSAVARRLRRTAVRAMRSPYGMPLEVIRALRKAVVSGQLAEPDAVAASGALMAAARSWSPSTPGWPRLPNRSSPTYRC